MLFQLFFLAFCLFNVSLYSAPTAISESPCAIAQQPDSMPSVFRKKDLRYAADRGRYSSYNGVCWYQGSRYLFVVHMQTSSIHIYEYAEKTGSCQFIGHFDNSDGIALNRPEGISFSKDSRFFAIPNMQSGTVQIFETNPENFFNTHPIATIQSNKLHSARFSPDGCFVAYTGLGRRSKICISRLLQNGDILPIQTIPHPQKLKPKSIDFSPDGRFVIISYCFQLNERAAGKAIIASYRFDASKGKIDPKALSSVEDLYSAETVTFSPDGSYFLAVDQIHDRVTGHAFDRKTGKIGKSWVALQNPKAQLFLPHGISFSSDGKYLAVSNHGDNKVTIYTVD